MDASVSRVRNRSMPATISSARSPFASSGRVPGSGAPAATRGRKARASITSGGTSVLIVKPVRLVVVLVLVLEPGAFELAVEVEVEQPRFRRRRRVGKNTGRTTQMS